MFTKKYFKKSVKISLGLKRYKIEKICCNEKLLSVKEVNLFCLWKTATAFKAKLVMFPENVFLKIASVARFIACLCLL